jgi:hypothetical protein
VSADRISYLSMRGNAPVSSLVLRKAAALGDLINELTELAQAGGHIDGERVASRLRMLANDMTRGIAPAVVELETLAAARMGVAK